MKLKIINDFEITYFNKSFLVLYYKPPIKLSFFLCLPWQQQTNSSSFGWWSFCVLLFSLLSSSSSVSPFHTQSPSLFFTVTFFSFFTILVTIIMHVFMYENDSWWVAGISDECSSHGVKSFTEKLISYSGVQGFCVYDFYIAFIFLPFSTNFVVFSLILDSVCAVFHGFC